MRGRAPLHLYLPLLLALAYLTALVLEKIPA